MRFEDLDAKKIRPVLFKHLRKYTEPEKTESAVSVAIQWRLVQEAIESTKKSILCDGKPVAHLSHFIIAGHFSYWFAKFQPLHVTNYGEFKTQRKKHKTLKGILEDYLTEGQTLFVDDHLYLNETIAIGLAYSYIASTQRSILENNSIFSNFKSSAEERINFEFRLDENRSIIPIIVSELAEVFREQSFSPVLWTKILESALKTNQEYRMKTEETK